MVPAVSLPQEDVMVCVSNRHPRPPLCAGLWHADLILGVFPLVVAKGAGAELRWSLGVTVFSGMIGVTLFGIFFTPVFYYVLERVSARR